MRILVIPAVPNTPLRHRAADIALALGPRHRVTLLAGERQPAGLGAGRKVAWHVRQALTWSRRRVGPGVTALRLPSLPRWPALSSAWQSLCLRVFARAAGVEAVVTQGTGEVRAPRRRGRTVVYDLPDDHVAGLERAGQTAAARRVRAFLAREVAGATAATASSRVLVRVLEREFERRATLVPNGTWVRRFRGVTPADAAALRARLALHAGPVVGFTGGLDQWLDAELLLEAWRAVRRAHPSAQLLVVGDGARAAELREADGGRGEGVTVTGFVPPDQVPVHVALFDVGVVPFARSVLTDAMLPIKVFDYAAARKPVVATPLAAYEGEELPFLRVAEREAFPVATVAAVEGGWLPAWDAAVERYDWECLVAPLEQLLGAAAPDLGARPSPRSAATP